MVALSFVRSPSDVELVHEVMDRVGRRVPVIAKLEKPEAIDNLEAIVLAFDAIMVARGDLGVELPLEQVPLVQKRAIQMARENARPVIVATQMLESMIEISRPTRAEASDVANAVLDGADAVMLSGETSVGKYPLEAVRTMARIITAVEDNSTAAPPLTHVPRTKRGVISYAARDIGERLDAKALVAFTRIGRHRAAAGPAAHAAAAAGVHRDARGAQPAGADLGYRDVHRRPHEVDRRDDPLRRPRAVENGPLQARRPGGHRRGRSSGHSRLDQPDPRAPDRGGRPLGPPRRISCRQAQTSTSCWRFWTSARAGAPDTFFGVHPSKNPVRTFGGQMMAQAFVAGSRTVSPKLPPSALSVHFIAGGDPAQDLELQVVRLRDERRFANRRVDVVQNGVLLATALISYLSAGRGLEHGIPAPEVAPPHGLPKIDDLLKGYEETVPLFVGRCGPSNGATPTTRHG